MNFTKSRHLTFCLVYIFMPMFCCRYRFLRSQDREMNKDNYPALNFPEVYLLEGGYKAFYHAHMVYKYSSHSYSLNSTIAFLTLYAE